MQLERLMEIGATQPNVKECYTLDADIAEAIKRVLGYLQPIVILMAIVVPSSEESRMLEKWGWEALAQATSMVLMVISLST